MLGVPTEGYRVDPARVVFGVGVVGYCGMGLVRVVFGVGVEGS